MISILTPVHNTDTRLLGLFINSVKKQSFADWELCIVNDGSTNPEVVQYLKDINHPRIKIKHLDTNVGIGLATEEAFKFSTGEYIAFMDSDDELHTSALELSRFYLKKDNADMVYSDEALISMDNKIVGAHYKPDYSPDLLLSQNYMCHFVMLKRDVYIAAGGLRGGFDGAQDHDFLLRVSEKTDNIVHIPKILYYWRTVPDSITHAASSKNKVWDRGVLAISESLERRKTPGKVLKGQEFGSYIVRYALRSTPLVSIIIPFKDNFVNLKRCLASIAESDYENYEIIIVINAEGNLSKFSAILKNNIQIVQFKGPFNFSKILNIGVEASKGEHIITLHDDVFPIKKDWIEALLEHSQKSGVGCVGGRLLFPHKTVQHAGVTVGVNGVCVHSFYGLPASESGYYGRALHIQNVSAVTGSCMMFRKTIFDAVGGFDENNTIIDFSDIDFCLRVQERGFKNIYTSRCEAEHLARGTRGVTLPPKLKTSLVGNDTKYMKSRHNKIISNGDPYYNNNFSKNRAYESPKVTEIDSPDIPKIRHRSVKAERLPEKRVKVLEHHGSIQTKDNPLVSFIVPLYDQYPIAIASILTQEYNNYEIVVVHDGPIPDTTSDILKSFKDTRIKILHTEKRYNDWGHSPREYALDHLDNKSELVVFTGADNYYIPKFINYMLNPFSNTRTVAAYCNCLHNYWDWSVINTRLIFGSIDCGCFMIRTKVAKKLGWKYRVHEADWKFIQNVMRTYGRNSISKVPKNLFVHN